jgi:hypothetical protein
MRCLITADKCVNDNRAIARQPPITIEKLWEAVFSVGSAPKMLRCYIRTITASVQFKNKTTRRLPQGAWRQDELTG